MSLEEQITQGDERAITIDRFPPFCIWCHKESDLQFIQDWEDWDFDGVTIPIYVEFFKCLDCGCSVEEGHPDYHPVGDAYAEYKRRTGKDWKGRSE